MNLAYKMREDSFFKKIKRKQDLTLLCQYTQNKIK